MGRSCGNHPPHLAPPHARQVGIVSLQTPREVAAELGIPEAQVRGMGGMVERFRLPVPLDGALRCWPTCAASLFARRWGSVASNQAASLNSRPQTSSIILYYILFARRWHCQTRAWAPWW
jgi:hypothetical protein